MTNPDPIRDMFRRFGLEYQEGKTDLHKAYAARKFGVNYEDVTPPQRKAAKNELYVHLYSTQRMT